MKNATLSQLKNLRKASISPWTNEEYMGEVLAGRKIIYHRKPSPNYIGVSENLDEDAWREHITTTLKHAKNCKVELTIRDAYTIHNKVDKAKRCVEIMRGCPCLLLKQPGEILGVQGHICGRILNRGSLPKVFCQILHRFLNAGGFSGRLYGESGQNIIDIC